MFVFVIILTDRALKGDLLKKCMKMYKNSEKALVDFILSTQLVVCFIPLTNN